MNILKITIFLVIAYLLGAIPNGLWIGKLFYHKDIRNYGSHNIGATNALRVLGVFPGVVCMILDIAKGSIATLLPIWFNIDFWNIKPTMLIFGIMAILGHSASIFDHFHGGKAVATSAGMLLVYSPWLFVYCFSMMVIMTLLTSMVSFASLFSFTTVTIIILLIHDWYLFPLAVILTIFVYYKHRSNIIRMVHGHENLIHYGLVYWHMKKKHATK
ncbi:glycerol-3-phosphate 1-O-acyltransferase PlsY [Acetilactobacillus jinshanensis]|uniref:glycerol-3-phosphate 1-O-acyltransferase PlsY n=1 Tax=Acetilactobacillus jinshanensis TaxID=1720083 RepID=UPI0030050F40